MTFHALLGVMSAVIIGLAVVKLLKGILWMIRPRTDQSVLGPPVVGCSCHLRAVRSFLVYSGTAKCYRRRKLLRDRGYPVVTYLILPPRGPVIPAVRQKRFSR
jgi:hypothetical protein